MSSIPEIVEYKFTPNDRMVIIGSDGLWEFIDNKEIIRLLAPFYNAGDLEGACDFLLNEALSRWN